MHTSKLAATTIIKSNKPVKDDPPQKYEEIQAKVLDYLTEAVWNKFTTHMEESTRSKIDKRELQSYSTITK